MKKVINCLKENNPVINKKLKEVTLEEGNKIATELFKILTERKDGIGLAANQVGIDASVAVVNVREPIILINPEVIEVSDEIPYYEGCLSFKGKGFGHGVGLSQEGAMRMIDLGYDFLEVLNVHNIFYY